MVKAMFSWSALIAQILFLLLGASANAVVVENIKANLGIAGDYVFETSPLMRERLPEDRRAPPFSWQTRSGAAGVNTKWEANNTLPWFIESQKEGWDWVASGVMMTNKDSPLLEKSVWLIRNGNGFEQSDGVNPEHNGHDTSYLALGLPYVCRYYQIVANDVTRTEMNPVLVKAFNWLHSRIQADGHIDGTGNTRTGPAGELGRNGKPKQLDYHTTAVVFAQWAQLTDDANWEKLARQVLDFDHRKRAAENSSAK